jgi:general secretion pathway protein G
MRFRSAARRRLSGQKFSARETCGRGEVRASDRGFTLIEMLVVISIIMVLLAVAVENYNHNVTLAKEAKLHQNLTTLNKLIQEYSLDKHHAPQSLDDLVQAGYVKFIPDDITGSSTTWVTEPEDPENAWDPNNQGIGSVHSGSDGSSLSGDPYSSWNH